MKRILFITRDLVLGGGQKQTVDLANGLHKRGFKIAILVFDKENVGNKRIKDIHPEISLLSPERNYSKVPLLEGTYETIKAVRQWKPDILYSRLWTTKPVAATAGKILGTKIVLGIADSEIHQTKRKKHKTLTKLYRKNVYRLADIVVAVSEGLAREARETYRLTHVKAIHNGIDIECVRRKSDVGPPHEYFRENSPVLVSVGRLSPQKGYKHLLKAFSIVSETTEARLLIVGDGEIRNELIRIAKTLDIYDKIAMVGEKVSYAYIKHGDIFISASLHEGMPNVILESMALGTPVIATDCDHGPAELIENGKSGLLVPVADPVKMASAIRRLIEDRNFAASLAVEAEKRVHYFTQEKMISNYENMFLNA